MDEMTRTDFLRRITAMGRANPCVVERYDVLAMVVVETWRWLAAHPDDVTAEDVLAAWDEGLTQFAAATAAGCTNGEEVA